MQRRSVSVDAIAPKGQRVSQFPDGRETRWPLGAIAPAALSPPPLLATSLDNRLQSIAVFPFKNLQDDPRYKSFERSIAENVMGSFSRSGRFRVVERSRLDELV